MDDAAVAEIVRQAEGPEQWFCDKGEFWGTPKQLWLCAKCGKNEHKRPDEARHYGDMFKPTFHTICDECFAALGGRNERIDWGIRWLGIAEHGQCRPCQMVCEP